MTDRKIVFLENSEVFIKGSVSQISILIHVYCVLQLQVQLQSGVPQPDLDISGTVNGKDDMDEIDAALTDLQVSLEGSSLSSPGDITHIPELQEYLKFFK